MPYELDRIRAAVDRVTDRARAITVGGKEPREIVVDLAMGAVGSGELTKKIAGSLVRELGADAAKYSLTTRAVG